MSLRRRYAQGSSAHYTQQPMEPFCDCEFPDSVLLSTHKGYIPDLIKCRCGEPTENTEKNEMTESENVKGSENMVCQPSGVKWSWQPDEASDTLISGPDIVFHPTYSQGTGIVRSELPLKAGMVHYWEMRVLTPLAGTDVMFGIGTDKVALHQFQYHFVSALGTNAESWGLSYCGKIQHNGVRKSYGQRFSQGCIVGICLDRSHGTLEFYLNRRSLGVAYRNIPCSSRVKLYAMVCSTAARSSVRLINSTSQMDCLQLRAFKLLSKRPKDLQLLREMPGFRRLFRDYWFHVMPVRYSRQTAATQLDIADEAVMPRIRARQARKQKYVDDDSDTDDLYSNAHKIAIRFFTPEEENDSHPLEGFDEYFHFLTKNSA
ncbi:SPRY domain-containing SOCS box protein 3 [Anastrepha obliqua]|uniref:SPRY domain-containing SOCS box protein 3 n=1 Tax=Anastrepha obliqua TaxID=95512 RepID=UPI00240A108C|nr:SPRY domain-containing SOCS box protein 3 [Anastrepha obliqua]